MKRCIVCSAAQPDDITCCTQCGFMMRIPQFLSRAQAQSWIGEHVLPSRIKWDRKRQKNEQQKLWERTVKAEGSAQELQRRVDTLEQQITQNEGKAQILQRQVHMLQEQLEQAKKQGKKQQELLPTARILTKENVQKTLQKNQREYHVWDNITTIGESAFWRSESLQRVYLPECVRSIQREAFCNCRKLEYINFPNNWLSIEEQAFIWCASLEKCFLPPTVLYIGAAAFAGCEALQSIEVDARNLVYHSEDGVLFTRSGKRLCQYPAGKQTAVYHVPNGVASICEKAFHRCQYLEEVVVSNSVTRIGESCFSECGKLRNITLPATVWQIEREAFRKCENLQEISLSEWLMEIEERTFALCKSLQEIHLPKGLWRIKEQAFALCSSLRRIDIPEDCKLDHIASDAFEGVTATVYFPKQFAGAEWVGKPYGGSLTWVAK